MYKQYKQHQLEKTNLSVSSVTFLWGCEPVFLSFLWTILSRFPAPCFLIFFFFPVNYFSLVFLVALDLASPACVFLNSFLV